MKNTCSHCNKEFSTNLPTQKFCSSYCRKQNWQRINRTLPIQNILEEKLNNKYKDYKIQLEEVISLTKNDSITAINNIEDKSGVYIFMTNDNIPFYIGSSNKIKFRMKYYFGNHIGRESLLFRLWRHKYKSFKFQVIYDEDYKDLEFYLIFKYKPVFNTYHHNRKSLNADSLIDLLTKSITEKPKTPKYGNKFSIKRKLNGLVEL